MNEEKGVNKLMNGWCFALINNRLAEIFFDKRGIYGYVYVSRNEYSTKKEQKWIDTDIEKYQFSHRKGVFKSKLTGEKIKLVKFNED